MASQQAYHAYPQNKGTLIPGQSITVNKFNVQVERYLSQGGFAHVYLVRTATPVYNTTHHVLKRIAVANEAMLKDVRKEVDVMRLLKGHPNIVHLIDAAWHKLPNGTFEVFILMEFCPGGGIIDMMNRRLRERLTEAEILQIFVDVCEGVACMHNLRPALLHRDLKVENILQTSPTSYKLCDFGSATAVSRPPATTEEIRALEADLNRHTTLQYRAPEMVDVYSRRPVDEKSDVWALGVLLYKLCYYTTPFEEHGQLAILNVQYRIPPYPAYSPQMIQLIASMLQEHGMRRPTVFEVLLHVHRLRGTKSRFKYVIPVPQPLSPRQQTHFQSPSSNSAHAGVPHHQRVQMSVSPAKSPGMQAREKVMEAIAPLSAREHVHLQEPGTSSHHHSVPSPQVVPPMRRGRPPVKGSESSATSSNSQDLDMEILKRGEGDDWLGANLNPEGSIPTSSLNDGWNVDGPKLNDKKDTYAGFGDDFGAKLWDSIGEDKAHLETPAARATSRKHSPSYRPSLLVGTRSSPDKDAFEGLGLGLSGEKPAPTLAEARKLRTGLAVMQSSGLRPIVNRSGGTSPRFTPSPRQTTPLQQNLYAPSVSSLLPNLQGTSLNLTQQPTSKRASPSQPDGILAETRFPSLEELDASFSPSISPAPTNGPPSIQGPEKSLLQTKYRGDTDVDLLKPESYARGYHARKGTRSEQVTGTAMQESGDVDGDIVGDYLRTKEKATDAPAPTQTSHETKASSRPSLTRRHRSSVSVKHINLPNSTDAPGTSPTPSSQALHKPPSRGAVLAEPKDWLTGDDELDNSSSHSLHISAPDEMPILRDSPSKRASFIQSNPIPIRDGVTAQHDHAPYFTRPSPPLPSEVQISPTLSRFTRSFPPIDISEGKHRAIQPPSQSATKSRTTGHSRGVESASSGDEGPEEAVSTSRPFSRKPPEKKGHKARQSSVHDLVDLYGGGLNAKEKERNIQVIKPISQTSSQETKARPRPIPLGLANLSPSTFSTSPNNLLSPPSIKSSSRPPAGNEQPTSGALSSPVASASRSRPQSLIIFPSKPIDSYSTTISGQPSPGLTPPEDPKHRKTYRRTSISDMVQRYEDISGGAKAVSSGSLSPIAPRPIVKDRVSPIDTRPPRTRPTADKDEPLLSSTHVERDDDKPLGSSVDQNQTSSAPTIRRPIPLRNGTIRQEPSDVSQYLDLDTSRPTYLTRRTTEKSLPRIESGSSSPERPYQGVGKLIDQWQRKTAGAESQKPNTRGRGPFVVKRGIAQDSFK